MIQSFGVEWCVKRNFIDVVIYLLKSHLVIDFLIWPMSVENCPILHQTKIILGQKQHMLEMTQIFVRVRNMKNFPLIAF